MYETKMTNFTKNVYRQTIGVLNPSTLITTSEQQFGVLKNSLIEHESLFDSSLRSLALRPLLSKTCAHNLYISCKPHLNSLQDFKSYFCARFHINAVFTQTFNVN